MVEAEFVLGGFEAILDRPAMTFHRDQGFDGSGLRTPCGEEGEVAVCDISTEQKAACPHAGEGVVIVAGVEVGQFQIGPVMAPFALRAGAGGEARPHIVGQIVGDLSGGSGNRVRLCP